MNLGRAIAIAAKAHETQKDRGGNAYILHPIRIMLRLRTSDEELMAIAILHDVVEDSEHYSLIRLEVEEGFSKRVLDALACLTHPKEEPYEDYIKRVGSNPDATRIKLEDLRDNSDITRLKGIRQKDIERIEKYHRAYLYLKKVHEANGEIYG
jgi:(p)ppGpp synthase/HD superfamily hydrolase